MTEADVLKLLKLDLQMTSSVAGDREDYLEHLIDAARRGIQREGITLMLSNPEDVQLIVMYAAYLYRKRDNDTGMPRMLRYALNNRLFSEQIKGGDPG